MRAKRKLFSPYVMAKIAYAANFGLSITKIRENLELDCSLPHITKNIEYYKQAQSNEKVKASLFPPWLKDSIDIQEPPDDYIYTGFFPFGEWHRR